MSGLNARLFVSLMVIILAIVIGTERLMAINANDQPLETGPDVVILNELENEYEAVPFDHLSHAKMAQMWHGCETCHHYSPNPVIVLDDGTTMALAVAARFTTATLIIKALEDTQTAPGKHTQKESIEIPACKSCHSLSIEESEIQMPGLKGAYHRQCLNCHKEWMHENACVICHEPKADKQVSQPVQSPGDIIGRMHPPIPEPKSVTYKTRFTPADGGNVLFRHSEHTVDYGIKCVDCHMEDNCMHCHGALGDTSSQKPLQPGMTWEESHGPCMGCHSEARCKHCHFKNFQPPPDIFDHNNTGQGLDKDHIKLACIACHANLKFDATLTCGGVECHEKGPVDYPSQLPGPVTSPDPDSIEYDNETSGAMKRTTGNEGK